LRLTERRSNLSFRWVSAKQTNKRLYFKYLLQGHKSRFIETRN
jgi:hypothetical protein